LLPTLALVTGGWLALPAWAAAGLGVGLAVAAPKPRLPNDAINDLRDQVRDAERERRHLHTHLERYPVLLDACLSLSGARSLQQLADGMCDLARHLVPDLTAVRVWFGTPEAPDCTSSAGNDGIPCPIEPDDEVRFVLAESRPLVRRDGQNVRALLPLRGDRRREGSPDAAMRGVLAVEYAADDIADRLAVELLGALARLGGIGLAAVDLLAQARSLALHDELTGLYGQHEFLRRLDEQAALARRQSASLGLLMCDMDKLKAYNDRFGHPAGDTALRTVANALRVALTGNVVMCRYGGEEFAALMPGATSAQVAEAAERVRAAIEASIPESAHPDRRVTASVGWTLLHKDETGRDALIRADQHCYAAKTGGRNRVEGQT
jgi:diguanylate cyclase (GGDEF)-like protein